MFAEVWLIDLSILPEGCRQGKTKAEDDEAFTALLKFVVDLVDLMDATMDTANQFMVFANRSAHDYAE